MNTYRTKFIADVVNQQQDTIAELLSALTEIMVMFPDMCADADMCDDPHTLSLINRARDVIARHNSSDKKE